MSRLETLLSPEELEQRLDVLAATLNRDYANEDLLLVGVLKGSYLFLAELSKRLKLDVQIDFVQVSSYGNEKSSSGVVQIRKDLDTNIEGRNVLIVEDIVDTGATLKHLRELFAVRKPKSIKFITLLSKSAARQVDIEVEYVGFEIENHFVVGYGLDFAERYRNLPYVAVLRDS